MRQWSATTWLIVIGVVGFLVDALLTPPPEVWPYLLYGREMPRLAGETSPGQFAIMFLGPIARWGHFSVTTAIDGLQPWRFVTFAFVEMDVWLLALNCACLYAFGRVLEAQVGARRFLVLCVLCTLGAAVSYVLLHALRWQLISPWIPLTGMTAAVLGTLVATACVAPDDEVPIVATGIFLPRRALAWIVCAIVAVVVIKRVPSGAGFAHLGGIVVALLAVPLLRRDGVRQNM